MSDFIDYCKSNGIGSYDFDQSINAMNMFFTSDDIVKMDFLVNASKGGLLLGSYHKDGGIQVISQNLDSQTHEKFPFKVVAEFEGNEYLVPPEIYELHKEEIEELNESIVPYPNYEFESFGKNFRCKVIDLRKSKFQVIYVEPQTYFIINCLATKENIERIIEMDTLLNW